MAKAASTGITNRSRIAAARARLAEKHATNPDSVERYQGRMARLAAVRRRDAERDGGWCILRTNARQTLALADSLTESGIEAWSPMEVRRRRLPRQKVVRESEEPIVPSFVFARATHLPDIMRALALPVSPHPRFSVFQHAGRAPVIDYREIRSLCDREEQGLRAGIRKQRPTIAAGASLRPTEGAFAGLDGVVESVKRGTAIVCFNGSFHVRVSTWLLLGDTGGNSIAQQGVAAT